MAHTLKRMNCNKDIAGGVEKGIQAQHTGSKQTESEWAYYLGSKLSGGLENANQQEAMGRSSGMET